MALTTSVEEIIAAQLERIARQAFVMGSSAPQ